MASISVGESITHHSPCPICKAQTNLSRCAACKVVSYCGRNHQLEHRDEHKTVCQPIKKARTQVEKAKAAMLQEEEENPQWQWDDPFTDEDTVGIFYSILETRPYMRARWAEADATMKVKNQTAVEAALQSLLDMLRLCRGDNLGVRDYVAFLYLRLGREQEAYDFLKWYATTGDASDYDWGNMELPYLDVKDADVFEPFPAGFENEYHAASHTIAMILLKIRIYLDLKSIQNADLVGSRVPQELLDSIRAQLISDVISKKKNLVDQDLPKLIETLRKQIKQLHKAVAKQNKYFWPALLQPDRHLRAPVTMYSPGNQAHMVLILQQSYYAWEETPGAIDVVKQLQSGKF